MLAPAKYRQNGLPVTGMIFMRCNMVRPNVDTKVEITGGAPADAADSEQARRQRVVSRLARIEGQVRGIQGMIADNRPCEQVALQLTAARRALDKAFYEMIACSLITKVDTSADMDEVRQSTEKMAKLLVKFG